jgi:hypothetical protein
MVQYGLFQTLSVEQRPKLASFQSLSGIKWEQDYSAIRVILRAVFWKKRLCSTGDPVGNKSNPLPHADV